MGWKSKKYPSNRPKKADEIINDWAKELEEYLKPMGGHGDPPPPPFGVDSSGGLITAQKVDQSAD